VAQALDYGLRSKKLRYVKLVEIYDDILRKYGGGTQEPLRRVFELHPTKGEAWVVATPMNLVVESHFVLRLADVVIP
jgi:hypothetical protein